MEKDPDDNTRYLLALVCSLCSDDQVIRSAAEVQDYRGLDLHYKQSQMSMGIFRGSDFVCWFHVLCCVVIKTKISTVLEFINKQY